MKKGNQEERFNALLVDADIQSRSRLKQAAHGEFKFKKVMSVNNMREAIQKLEGADRFDVIFVAHADLQDEIPYFIREAKTKPRGDELSFILVMKPDEQNSASTADNLISGAHGFLYEPFSVLGMKEIVEIAVKVKKEAAESRFAAAMTITFDAVSKEIDKSAMKRQMGKMGDILSDGTAKKLSKLQREAKEMRELYFEKLIESMEKAQPPLAAAYSGASERVRARMKKKMMDDIRKEEDDSEVAADG